MRGMITMLVEVPRWTQSEIVAVATADRVAAWRDVDLYAVDRPTEVSLDVNASTDAEARQLVRVALGDLHPDAFLASTT
jgi:hypothetical protein